MTKYLLQCFIISTILLRTMASEKRHCTFTQLVTVYVINNLPPNSAPLVVHCASKDDDLGNHTLTRNQDFQFEFCENFFSTLFYCHLWWEKKHIRFDAFRETWLGAICAKDICYWAAKSDGIYYSNYYPPRGLKKKYDW
ncbi:hypothetical protein Pfo_015620 [Paulownia fortunei]|nr:hypothetical protein Pfo_015620 [Paulownia fortunei]